MAAPKIFVFAPADRTGETYRMLEGLGCDLTMGEASWATPRGNNEEEMCRLALNADGLIGTSIRSSPISREIMLSSETLRIVAKYTIGVDDIDVEAATELGILVTHAPVESNWGGVAEGTMAIMLGLLKKSREKDELVKGGGWRDENVGGTYIGSRASDGYEGITIGIIGQGRVGSRVADLLAPWKVRILAYDPYIPASQFTDHGTQSVDLPTLLRESDVVSLHVVLTRETRHMIGEVELGLMKPTAVLINTARGGVVEEGPLAAALQKGDIAAAGVDVFEEEPLPDDNPLKGLGNKVMLSPHMVSSARAVSGGTAGMGLGTQWATDSLISALKGEVPDHVYNQEVIPRWRERFENNSLFKSR